VASERSKGDEWNQRYEQSLRDEHARNEMEDDPQLAREFFVIWFVLAVPFAVLGAMAGHDRSIWSRIGSAVGLCLITYFVTARLIHDD